MTAARKKGIEISVLVALVGLAISIIALTAKGASKFGGMDKEMEAVTKTADCADARSHSNKAELTGVEAKVDIVLDQLKNMDRKLDSLR